jgi:ArsR family transcriptional regulator
MTRNKKLAEPEGICLMKADQFYKCLANETRLRCLMLLLARDELCVCDIADALDASQPMTSRHLAQLRSCNLVSDHRKGQWVYYRLHAGLESWQREVLATTQEGLGTEAPYGEDLSRLQAIERQNRGCC